MAKYKVAVFLEKPQLRSLKQEAEEKGLSMSKFLRELYLEHRTIGDVYE